MLISTGVSSTGRYSLVRTVLIRAGAVDAICPSSTLLFADAVRQQSRPAAWRSLMVSMSRACSRYEASHQNSVCMSCTSNQFWGS